jgi:hypothetical protein
VYYYNEAEEDMLVTHFSFKGAAPISFSNDDDNLLKIPCHHHLSIDIYLPSI